MTARRLNAFVRAFFLALGLLNHGALPAHGCSCAMPDPYAGLAEADAAFVGSLVEVDRGLEPMTDSAELVDFHFEVEASLKGEIGDVITVKSATSGASCGIEAPIGSRAGFLLDQQDGEWHGNLCWTVDADALLAAAEGVPEPVQGSPPHLIIFSRMGDADMIALDREGRIVGYGEGPQRWLVSACPDEESFIGTGEDTIVRVWSFTTLDVVGEYPLASESSPWVRNLICAGPGGNPFLAVTVDSSEVGSLVRYADGSSQVLMEEIEILTTTAAGLVAIASNGTIIVVDPDTGSLEELIDPIGDVRNQLGPVVPSPDGSNLAVSVVNWNANPPRGRVVILDLEEKTSVEMTVACDVYPVWIDDEQISIWETCTSDVGGIYTPDLELIGEGGPPESGNHGWSVTDEDGAVFYPGELGMKVIETG